MTHFPLRTKKRMICAIRSTIECSWNYLQLQTNPDWDVKFYG